MVEPLAKWKYIFLPIILLWCIIGGLCITIASWTIRVCWGKAYQHSFEAEFARKAIEKVEILRDGVAIASSEEARAMDKHKRLWDLIPNGERFPMMEPIKPEEGAGIKSMYDYALKQGLTERAAIVWLLGKRWKIEFGGATYMLEHAIHGPVWDVDLVIALICASERTLCSARYAAAEHDREGE